MISFWKGLSFALVAVVVTLLGVFNFSTTKSRLECGLEVGAPSRQSFKLELYRPWVFWSDFDGFMSDDGDRLYLIELDKDKRLARLRAGPKLLPAGEYSLDTQRLVFRDGYEQFEVGCVTL